MPRFLVSNRSIRSLRFTAIPRAAPTSPWVLPGDYTVVLTANGKNYSQPLTVKMDPRVKVSGADLADQLELSRQLCQVRTTLEPIGKTFDSLVEQLTRLKEQSLPNNVADKLNVLTGKLKGLGPPNPRPEAQLSLSALDSARRLFDEIQRADAAPTKRVKAAVNAIRALAASTTESWKQIMSQDLPALDRELQKSGLHPTTLKP